MMKDWYSKEEYKEAQFFVLILSLLIGIVFLMFGFMIGSKHGRDLERYKNDYPQNSPTSISSTSFRSSSNSLINSK